MEVQVFNARAEYMHALRAAVHQVSVHDQATGPLALSYYLEQAQGAYPVDVVATLAGLGLSYQEDGAAGHSPPAAPISPPRTTASSLFADPHPADYDWRFNTATISALTQTLLGAARGGNIALLGTKTLFAPLVDRGASVTLFNKSQAILNDLRVAGYRHGLIECDLSRPLAPGHGYYQVVLADPPWYMDYYRAFLHRAAELLAVGGTAYVSVLPELTRPGAAQDRTAIIQLAATLGLQLLDRQAGHLVYETPGFEQQALQVRGLYCRDWRRGDLWTFRKLALSVALPPEEPIRDEPTWVEYRIGMTRIKAKPALPTETVLFTYQPVDPSGSVLTHVSRRSPFRAAIDVWTSANQAYTVTRMVLLHAALALLVAGQRGAALLATLGTEHQLNETEKLNLLALLVEITP